MVVVTILSLSYIHMQMQIIYLAYQGHQKEQQIKKLIEENGNATYNILMLKSANHLGGAMFSGDSDMRFADADDIIRVAATQDVLTEDPLGTGPQLAVRSNPFLNFLSFGRNAEAKTSK
jgi:hypothetical protein